MVFSDVPLARPPHLRSPFRFAKTPLRARSRVISLHFYYTRKYPQKSNGAHNKGHNKNRTRLRCSRHGPRDLRSNIPRARSNYYSCEAFAYIRTKTDLKYNTHAHTELSPRTGIIRACLLGGKGEIIRARYYVDRASTCQKTMEMNCVRKPIE